MTRCERAETAVCKDTEMPRERLPGKGMRSAGRRASCCGPASPACPHWAAHCVLADWQLGGCHVQVLENRRGKAGGVYCASIEDITNDGVKDLLIGRDDGLVEVRCNRCSSGARECLGH